MLKNGDCMLMLVFNQIVRLINDAQESFVQKDTNVKFFLLRLVLTFFLIIVKIKVNSILM